MQRLIVIAAALLLAGVPAAAPADTYPRQPGIDVQQYVFRLVVRDDTDAIDAVATAELRFRADGLRAVQLDLQGDAAVPDHGMTVTGVWMADALDARRVTAARLPVADRGAAVPFEHANDRVRIQLVAPSRAGQRVFLTVAYHGTPAGGLHVGANRYGDRTFFSDNWPNHARQWLPTIDHPYDKAASQMVVVAPAHYQVISNGLLIESTDLGDGRRLTHWRQSVPIAPWLYVLGVARFAVHHDGLFGDVPVQTWVYPQDRATGLEVFPATSFRALAFFSDHIGPYAYEKLANIQAASVGGGMEAASAIFYGEESATGVRPGRWHDVIVHEIAHQWFGNAVTEADWDDVWLSEGFATYFTLLYREHANGRDDFVAGLQAARDRIFAYYEEHPDYRVIHDNLADMSQVTTGMQYQRGAWTLHMLRGIIGTERFWSGIRSYYRTFRDSNATTADFRQVMEIASETRLDWFFDQWLRQGGVPEVEVGWRYDPEAGAARVRLAQVQAGPERYRLPLTVRLHFADGTFLDRAVDLPPSGAELQIDVPKPPTRIQIDPDTWVLARFHLREQDRP